MMASLLFISIGIMNNSGQILIVILFSQIILALGDKITFHPSNGVY